MITLFIIFAIICVIAMSKKDKHNKAEDEAAIVQLPSFSVQARPMSAMSKIANLAVTKSQLLHSFSYSNNLVTVTTEDGNCIKSSLSTLSVQFAKVNGLVNYTIKGAGRKMTFYQTTNITGKEWDAINSTLCLAGTTWGRDIFSKEAKYAGYVNIALKAIKALS